MDIKTQGASAAPMPGTQAARPRQRAAAGTRGRLAALVLIASSVLAGCGGGGGGGTGSPLPLPVPPADITLIYGHSNVVDAQVGVAMTVAPQMTGLNGHVPVCTLDSGTLPAGITLQRDCTLSGTPLATVEGESGFTVGLSVPGYMAAATATVNVELRFARITYTGLPPELGFFITLGWQQPVDAIVASVDGFALSSVTNYQIVQGTLPDGLAFDPSSGRISGKPTQANQPARAVTIQATAHTTAGDFLVFVTLNLRVGDVTELNLAVAYPSPVHARVGAVYTLQPTITGARYPLAEYGETFSSSAASQYGCNEKFPALGLSLDINTGIISGTPTSSGTFCTLVFVQMFHADEPYAYLQAVAQITVDP